MQSSAKTVNEYLASIPAERKESFSKLRDTVLKNIPKGFKEEMNYGMLGYVVPHTIYPNGYHCDPKAPLPFTCIASQKNFVALYHMGIYSDKALLDWFVKEYAAQCKHKLDMGKSCIRFKKMDDIPYKLIGELMKKMTVKKWVELYESNLRRSSAKK